MPGIKPGQNACKTNALPAVLLLQPLLTLSIHERECTSISMCDLYGFHPFLFQDQIQDPVLQLVDHLFKHSLILVCHVSSHNFGHGWVTVSYAQGLLLSLCSGTNPCGTQRTIHGARDKIGVGHNQGHIFCTISLTQSYFYLKLAKTINFRNWSTSPSKPTPAQQGHSEN